MKIKNNIINLIVIAIIFVFIISFIYYYDHTIIRDAELYEVTPGYYAYQIESAELDNNNLNITGWCLRKDESISDPDVIPMMRIVLVDMENYSQFYYYKANNGLARNDVNYYYQNELDYTYCGFDASLDLKKLDTEGKDYEVLIQPNEREEYTIRPGLFLHNGILMEIKPNNDTPTEIDGTDLSEIVNNGIVRTCLSDIGVYVYQYKWKVYYFLEEKYPIDDGWTRLVFNVGTNRPELLPEEMREYEFDNLSFSIFDYEITDNIDSGKYKVIVYDLPTDYPIVYVDTGYYTIDGWLWRCRFCPGIPENVELQYN